MVTLNTMKTQYFLDIHADVLANQNAIATYIGPPNDDAEFNTLALGFYIVVSKVIMINYGTSVPTK